MLHKVHPSKRRVITFYKNRWKITSENRSSDGPSLQIIRCTAVLATDALKQASTQHQSVHITPAICIRVCERHNSMKKDLTAMIAHD